MGVWLSFVFVICFVLIHFLSKELKFLRVQPRSKFLSVAGGISVTYVFMHLLPELGEYQEGIEGKLSSITFLQNHIYIVAMLGLALFLWVRAAGEEIDEATCQRR